MSSNAIVITPDLLHYLGGGSDKIYIVTEFNGIPSLQGKGMTSWGGRNKSVSHKVLPAQQARDKYREQTGKGYRTVDVSTVGIQAIEAVAQRIQSELRTAAGNASATVTARRDGSIEVELSPSQQRPASRPAQKADAPVYDFWCRHAA